MPHTNALAGETSPYLLQHAHNPVDWHPWGSEALKLAKDTNKPIFLSVGYSTCYWCHVMERESFENEATAAELNAAFVPIKVDREERPDIDQLYMTAVQLMTRSGGWPMSVFLTPDGRPFYGGTYFAPDDYGGRPGFPSLLRSIADAWASRRDEVEKAADSMIDAVTRFSLPGGAEMPLTIDVAMIDNIVGRSVSDYDKKYGGFGTAPKFPRETLLDLLLAYCQHAPTDAPAKAEIGKMLAHTLEMMARGGIRDHLGGGFHRYSTDAYWLVPHFEIMLYDNAMLLGIYAQAAKQFGRPDLAAVARGIGDFILRSMTGPEGQFYTALDAETDHREGEPYLWTREQIGELLSEREAAHFNRVYGVDRGENFADPHHGSGEADRNVLFVPQPLNEVARQLGMTAADIEAQLAPMRAKLLAARNERKQPMLDTKVLTSWNALMIRGLAQAGRLLGETRYIAAAEEAMRFLMRCHRSDDGGFWRCSRDGKAKVAGFLDDYAYVAQALLELHHATGSGSWKSEAEAVVTQMQRRFASPAGAFYFSDAGHGDLLVRQAVAADSPLPSGNAVAAQVLIELGHTEASSGIVSAFADAIDKQGEAHSALVQAAMETIARSGPIAVPPRDLTRELRELQRQEVVTAKAWRKGSHQIIVEISVPAGYHINADEVPPGLYPTRLTIHGHQGRITYPPATQILRLPDGQEVGVYSGQVDVMIDLPELAEHVKMILRFQPCSDSACLEARVLELEA